LFIAADRNVGPAVANNAVDPMPIKLEELTILKITSYQALPAMLAPAIE
jgi:hypothetical protein